jgi:ribonucleoside-diphosphate reductase alpha chain
MVDGHPNIKIATSIVDYVFRVLGVEYLKRYEFAHVPPTEEAKLMSPTEIASPHEESNSIIPPAPIAVKAEASVNHHDTLDAHLGEMMGDAPMCDTCGHITVRNGACYKCLNCGNSMGCS